MRKLVVLFYIAFMIGCHSTPKVSFAPLGPTRTPKSTPSEVSLFITKKPSGDYKEIGILSHLTYTYNPDDSVFYNLLREEAARLGADGIIVLEGRTETHTGYTTKQTYQGKVYRAMAISYE